MAAGYLALAFAAAFAGAALYAILVEQPARMALDDEAMMKEWTPSDRRGTALLNALALLSAICGLAQFYAAKDARWLAGAVAALASWPYAYFVVVPLNNRLLASGRSAPDSRLLVRDWGVLEWGFVALGTLATGAFLWALA